MSETGQKRRSVHEKAARTATAARIDRRAARTRHALLRALHSLAEEKDYGVITVGEIAEVADIGRSTFYPHFTGKDDLLRFGIAQLGEHFTEWRHGAAGNENAQSDPLAFSLFMFRFFHRWPDLCRAITRGHARKMVLDQLPRLLIKVLRENLKTLPSGASIAIPRELIVQHTTGAFVAVFYWWLERGARETPEDMDAAFRRLIMDGLGQRFG